MINQFNNNGQKEGIWEEYYINNNLYKIDNYINGKLDGYYQVYHANGKRYNHGFYKNNIQIGYWEQYQFGYNKIISIFIIYDGN